MKLNPHFEPGKSIGPRPLGLSEVIVSKELSEAISNKDILKALKLGIGSMNIMDSKKGIKLVM